MLAVRALKSEVRSQNSEAKSPKFRVTSLESADLRAFLWHRFQSFLAILFVLLFPLPASQLCTMFDSFTFRRLSLVCRGGGPVEFREREREKCFQ